MAQSQRSELSPVYESFKWKPETSVGLTYGFAAGTVINASGAIVVVAEGTVALTDAATNYIEISAAGAVSKNTSGFTPGKYALAQVVTAGGEITQVRDCRNDERPINAVITPQTAPVALVGATYTISAGYSQAEVTALRDALVTAINANRTAMIAAGVEL